MAYLFHTIGELCISPVALSFITKLSPVKYASLMMGVYFCCDWIGNKVAGIMGESASDLGEYSVFFGNISIYACSWFYICYVFEAITTPHSWS
jgi:POT family proton-dependent oligopeptide transporter